MRKEEPMKGYKAFLENWKSINGFQYKVGKTYEMDEEEP